VARYRLAQLNVGHLRAPLTSPELAGFVALFDPLNALAESFPGFVWRLMTEEGNATAVRLLADDSLLVNLSVWESVEDLADFAYRSAHRDAIRRRREWFTRMAEASHVLWWVEAGHLPTVAEAVERLLHLRRFGPTPHAFTFRAPEPPPGGGSSPLPPAPSRECPTRQP